ncbi:MAG: primosomal protein N', partial [Nitrospinae bacterium]|nr:primosomal protein N' [Nitrospinota bacterium]
MFAQVIVDRPLKSTYTYVVPENFLHLLTVGSFVKVPFGKTYAKAVVLHLIEKVEETKYKIKSISDVEEHIPPLSSELLKLFKWGADYYHSTLSEMIFSSVPGGVGKKPKLNKALYIKDLHSCTEFVATTRAKNQVALVKKIMESQSLVLFSYLNSKEKVALKAVEKKGLLEIKGVERFLEYRNETSLFSLTTLQKKAYQEINTNLSESNKAVFLLHGVTGSGKTNVYLHLTDEVLKKGGSVLVLLPEISLSYQIFKRFHEQFGDLVTMIHSDIDGREKSWIWEQINKGKIRVVVGARSSLFAPLNKLGLIVIDEEHDSSFKRDESPPFNARDMAVVRGKFEGATVVLGSATPSLETVHNVKVKKYRYLLMEKRVNKKPLPETSIVNLSGEFKKGIRESLLSQKLLNEITKNLHNKEQ